MESSKLSIKFYIDDTSHVKLADVVPVFHSWIQLHLIPDHLLIDVADYAHVSDGPGVVLVAHEANFYMDRFDGRQGLTYTRKQPLDGSFTDRLRFVFRAALQACRLLETNQALLGIKFRTNEADLKINDRLQAPNTAQTFAALKPELEKFTRDIYGDGVKLEHRADEKRLFEVALRSSKQIDLATLVDRFGVG
jgi:hypothetical protein